MTMVIPCMSMVVHVMGSLTWILIGQTEYDYVQIKGPWADHGLVIIVITMCRNNDLNLKKYSIMFTVWKIKDCKQKSKTLNMDFMLILKPCQSLMNLQESPSVTLA